jgi:homocysteine S-methyltransferase
MDNYDLVPSGLIKLIKQGFNAGIDHSGTSIGQPTNFFVGAALNLCPTDMDNEIKNLQRKIKAGADFFLTQPVYRADDGPTLIEAYEAKYGKLDKPILAGILPLVNVKHAGFLHNEVPGISIPDEILKRIEAAGNESVKAGVEITVELVNQLKAWAGGVYIMPQFHKYDMVAEIIEQVKVDK